MFNEQYINLRNFRLKEIKIYFKKIKKMSNTAITFALKLGEKQLKLKIPISWEF